MEDNPKHNTLQKSLTWLQHAVQGAVGHELETRSLQGLRITYADSGFIRCNFIVPSFASDVDGYWHVGAMATLMDIIGAVTVYSVAHRVITSIDFCISCYATVKIQVEIEAKVIANRGKLTQVRVEVRRKGNGELIALGKLWMASNKLTLSHVSKI